MSGGSYLSGGPALPKRNAEELARDLRGRGALLGAGLELLTGERFEAPATSAMMHEAADMIDALRGQALSIELGDLAALVANLASEHFPYNERGAAALRAYRVLAEAVETDAPAIALSPTNQQTDKPQRTDA